MLTEDKIVTVSQLGDRLKTNQPLLLNAPQTVWSVQSGSLAVFTLFQGRRRYLFNVQAGEAMFSTATGASCQLLAMALEPTEVLKCSQVEFCQQMRERPSFAVNQLETWIHHLGSTFSSRVSSTLPTPISNCGVLATGEVFQPPQDAVIWVRLLQGKAKLLAMSELELAVDGDRLPLSSHLWFQALDTVEIDIRPPQAITQVDTFLNGLERLQNLCLRGIEQLEQQELQQEIGRFQAREDLNVRAVTETLDELASIFQTKQITRSTVNSSTTEDALLSAVGAVGRALGMTVVPPADSEVQRRQDPLEAIARSSQFRIRRVTLRDQWWKQDSGALLAYTQADHHPVALIPSDSGYEMVDPSQQTRVKCTPQLVANLSPTAYTFYRSLPLTLKPLTLLKFALRGHFKELWVVLIMGIAATLLGMVTPQATAILIDQAIPDADRRLLLQMAFGLLATAFGTVLFQLTQGLAIMRLEAFADASTQTAIWDRLLKLKASFFRDYSIGDLSSRVSAVSQIRQKLGNTLLKSLFSSVFSFLNLGLLFYYSFPLALIALLVAAINIAVTIASSVLTLRKVRPLLDRQGKLFGMMVQIINGVAKFRVAGAETRAFAYWGKHYTDQLKLTLGTQGIEDNLAIINHFLSALTPAVLFGFATHLLQQSEASGGSFSTGTFLAFNAAFGTFIGGATSLSTTVVDVLDVLPIWQRALPILHAVPEVDESREDPGRLSGRVAIANAVFRYRPDGALILNDVSIHAEPGEFIALVGPSGSGKSTLFRLLLGFDTPESGVVSYDGQDLASLDVNAVRRQLGVVLQNSRLMSASIFENISSSALITMDEAWEAARMSGLADDIAAMPMGMHTVVSEGGTNLSGGQRQRLLIARALALRPRILLFDEATSALDNRTQAIVSESLDKLKVTRVVVAHRLSTIRNADRIYVLQSGRVVESGDFEQLALQDGLFSQLIKRQRT